MKKVLLLILLFAATVSAQQKFDIKDASKIYDVRIQVENCERGGFCRGKLKVELFKKSAAKPFQVFNLAETEFLMEEAQMSNSKLMYDYQSTVFLEDYNFDGAEDLAIRDGNYSGYGGPSYQIYLFSPQSKKFIHNQSLTDLAQNGYLGMFTVDKKKKVLRAFSKSGCCWHQTLEFSVVGNRPKKVFEATEDATSANGKRVKITTKRLVKGRWQTRIRYEARKDN